MDTLCDDLAQIILEILPIHAKAALRRTSKSWQASTDDGPFAIPTTAALNAAWLGFSKTDRDEFRDPISDLPPDLVKVLNEVRQIANENGAGYGGASTRIMRLPEPLGVYLDCLSTKPSASAFSQPRGNNSSTGHNVTSKLLWAPRRKRSTSSSFPTRN